MAKNAMDCRRATTGPSVNRVWMAREWSSWIGESMAARGIVDRVNAYRRPNWAATVLAVRREYQQ